MEKINKETFDKLRGIEIGKMQEQKRIIEIIDKRYLEDRKIGKGTGEFWNNLKQQIQEEKKQ